MNLEELPKPIRLPLQGLELVSLLLGGLFFAIGVATYLFTSEKIAGYVFSGLGVAAFLFAMSSYLPYIASVAKNQDILVKPVKEALSEEGYSISTKKIMMMWSEGEEVSHNGRTFHASGRQATKFTLVVM